MPEIVYINPLYNLSRIDPSTVKRRISYSQWSMFEKCPKQWELSYIRKLRPTDPNIHQVFGTAMHEVLQKYLLVMYTDSVKKADWLDLPKILITKMRDEYKSAVEAHGSHFSNSGELEEFTEDGIAILDWFKKRRRQYFSSKNMELLAIEADICWPVSKKNKSVYMYGFLDIVLRDKDLNKITIIDIKTSRMGWNKYQKKDKLKAAQLVIYKKYFSEQYNVPIENIDVEFFIVKRKLLEESMFPQKRIQTIRPSSGKVTQNRIQKKLESFVEHCFDEDGNKRESADYPALAGKGMKNCKYCPFKTDYEKCPKEDRIRG